MTSIVLVGYIVLFLNLSPRTLAVIQGNHEKYGLSQENRLSQINISDSNKPELTLTVPSASIRKHDAVVQNVS